MPYDHVIHMRRVAELRVDPLNPRGPLSDDDPKVLELVESIKLHGLLTPLLVTPDRLVVDGHRRFAAARLAGAVMVPTTVRPLSETERLELQLVANLQREDLTPLQEARAFRRLVDAGSTAADVARRLGLSPRRVRDRLGLLELDEETAARVDRGELPLGAVDVLAGVEDLDERRELAEGIAERRVRVADVSKPRAPRALTPPPALAKAAPEPGELDEDLDDVDTSGPREADGRPVELLEAFEPVDVEPDPEPELTRRPRVASCDRCALLREQLIAALDSVRGLEDFIRETLGEEYVPDRARVIRERRTA